MWSEKARKRHPSTTPLQYPLYSILDVLHLKSEDQLQIILRWHEDGGLTWKKDRDAIAMRDRLEAALDALSLLEHGYEIGMINPKFAAATRTELE